MIFVSDNLPHYEVTDCNVWDKVLLGERGGVKVFRPVPVQEVVQGEFDPRFIAVLETLPPYVESAVLKCRKRFSTWSDGDHKFHRVSLCRKRHWCPIDAKVYAYGLADDAVEVVSQMYGKVGARFRFGVLDFTLPRDLWPRVGDGELGDLRRIAWSVINEVLGGEGLVLGGVGVAQFWHSADPLSGWYPHVHFTSLNMGFKDGVRVEIPVYIDHEKVARIRALWRERVQARWGASNQSYWDVFPQYSQGYGHFRHRLAYAFRYPIVDLYKAITGEGHVSQPPDGWLRRMLLRPEKEKRVQWFGWMSQRYLYQYAERLELEIPKKPLREKERRKVFCPYCGKELHKVSEGLTREEVGPHAALLVFDRGGGSNG